jgi:hypothetical protein
MFDIKSVLTESDIKQMPKGLASKLEGAINSYVEKYEAMMESKFEAMTESLADKFNNAVTEAVVSGVQSRVNQSVDRKMKDALQSVMNILESNGFHVSEETKVLTKKVELLEDEIARGAKIHKKLEQELEDAKKKDYIRERLSGMNPNIIADALKYYDSKTMYDVEDTIDMFVDNNYKRLTPHSDMDSSKESFGDVDIKDVNEIVSRSEGRKTKMESIMNKRGLMLSSHTFNDDDCDKAVSVDDVPEVGYDDEDVKRTMQINQRYESFNFR